MRGLGEGGEEFQARHHLRPHSSPYVSRFARLRVPSWLRQLGRHRSGVVSAFLVSAIISMIALSPWLAPYDPLEVDVARKFSPPSRQHLLGTDEIGRDVFSRIILGGRISLLSGILVPALAALLGGLVGIIAGFVGGGTDELLMRVVDVMLAFPSLLLALAIVAALGSSLMNAMIAIMITWIPVYARLLRGQVMAVKGDSYVEAAIALGSGRARLLLRHIIPNCLAPVVVKLTLDVGRAIRYLATLSFLGLGVNPPSPEWGAMVASGRRYLDYWWLPVMPGVAIYLTSLSLSFLGDAISDVLNPRLRDQGVSQV